MSLPDYDVITQRLGIPRCRGLSPKGGYCHFDHEDGEVAEGQVHWGTAHRLDRRNIRRYLFLYALLIAERRGFGRLTLWEQLYDALRELPALAREAKVKIPHDLGDHDRATLKAMIVGLPNTGRRKEAMRWLQNNRNRSGGAPYATE